MQDFIRVAAAVPDAAVADPLKNTENILNLAYKAAQSDPDIIVFPELCITGYTCADLFFNNNLLSSAIAGLKEIAEKTKEIKSVIAVGLPIGISGRLYNCAAVIFGGKILGIVPKTYIPTYNEFYEGRWFSSGSELLIGEISLPFADYKIPVGTDLIFDTGSFKFGCEICEDLWAAVPPGNILSLAGAEVILNLSASNETISKRNYRRNLISQQSASSLNAYVYVSAGCKESTTDLIFSGHSLVCENGRIIAENKKKIDTDYVLISDIDLGKIRTDRYKIKTFSQSASLNLKNKNFRTVRIDSDKKENDALFYSVFKYPFVPESEKDRAQRCMEIFEMQVMGLKKRMEITKSLPVIGVSGGLDSTLALLVSARAAALSGLDPKSVTGITMPAFGTTDRTHSNSVKLMEQLGVNSVEIPISNAVMQHFKDIGQDPDNKDLTYENSQARERTQVLMDYAGKSHGFVVGTGDLSELALGWCTYNADHMSMYGVNSSVPKTLIRWMIDSIIENNIFDNCKEVLKDILDTPVSPELLPPDENGKIAQQTEEIVGPYALHDFYLYYFVRFGFTPKKIYDLALLAFKGEYDSNTIKKWLIIFLKRFFSQQFKRSCLPDGVKIGSICLSPRGDWRMPSDAEAEIWIKQAEEL